MHFSGERAQMLFLESVRATVPVSDSDNLSTSGTTVAFSSHIFYSSSFNPSHFPIFLILLSLWIAASITSAFFVPPPRACTYAVFCCRPRSLLIWCSGLVLILSLCSRFNTYFLLTLTHLHLSPSPR